MSKKDKEDQMRHHMRKIGEAFERCFDDDLYPDVRRKVLLALENGIEKCCVQEDVDVKELLAIDLYNTLLNAGFAVVTRQQVK